MRRQIITRIGRARKSIAEAGAVVNVGGRVATPGKRDVPAHVERVALVMVQRTQAGSEHEISKTASDRAAALCDLVRVRKMHPATMRDSGGAQRLFPSTNH